MALLAIIFVVVAFFFLYNNPVPSSTSATSTPALATTLAPDMTVTRGNNSLEQVGTSTQVYVHDTLRTSHSGRGLLQEANGTETLLDYDTKLTLAGYDGTGLRTSGFLALGALWARVEKVFGKGEYYEIETQNAVAVVRGTSFGVWYMNGVTTLEVATGTVGFMPKDAATGGRLEGRMVFVSGGNRATIDQLGVVRINALTVADKRSPWYIHNVPESVAPVPVPVVIASPPGPIATTTPPVPPPPPTPKSSPLIFTSVNPSTVVQGDTVTLSGSGFYHLSSIDYSGTVLARTEYSVTSDSSITVSTKSIPAGTYDLRLTDATDAVKKLNSALTVTAPAPLRTNNLP